MWSLYPWEKTWYPLYTRLGRPRGQSEWVQKIFVWVVVFLNTKLNTFNITTELGSLELEVKYTKTNSRPLNVDY